MKYTKCKKHPIYRGNKTFRIGVDWLEAGEVEVQANSLDEAIDKAIEMEELGGGFELPKNGDYIDGSFQINEMSGYEIDEE